MPRTASTRPSIARRTLRSVLAAYLACLLGVSPLLGLVHMLTADHGHSYCDEHQQIEDIPLGSSVEGQSVTPEGTPLVQASGLPIPGSNTHASCPFLNHGALLTAPLPASSQTVPAVLAAKTIAAQLSGQADFAACPLLLAAPKTSPPS